MARYDVVVIGAGAGGLSAAALLAKEGKSVLVVERSQHLGGRGQAVDDHGFKLNVGGHLMEDSGSGLTKVFEYVGKELVHSKVSDQLPIWRDGKWHSIRDFYAGTRGELKKVITALVDTPYEELDRWDDRPLRSWLAQYTSDEGVYALFEYLAVVECLTDRWYDHSASDNLYVRKMHYEDKHMAAYSFWPGQGWDGMFADLRDALLENGGELRTSTSATRVVIENEAVRGVAVRPEPKILINDYEEEIIETDCVISNLPVWDVLRVVPETQLPDYYVDQIKHLAQDKYRVAWLGLYLATREPVYALAPEEISTWVESPITKTPGFFFNMTAMSPDVSPEGTYLHVAGAVIPGARGRDAVYVEETFTQFEEEIKIMYPGLRNAFWRKRHMVYNPSFGVIQKPYLVGAYRPHWRAPNVDGLFFASETFRSRGIGVDRAARAALTVVEDYLGRRLSGFEGSWRY